MKRQSMLRFAMRFLAGFAFLTALRWADGGKFYAYVQDHNWLCLLPLALVFLVLLARAHYVYYRGTPEKATISGGTHNTSF
jgi:hypothetical protein